MSKKHFYLLTILFISNLVFGQDLELEQFTPRGGVAVNIPGAVLPDTCPDATYDLDLTIKSTAGVDFGTNPITIRITVTGSNPGVYTFSPPDGAGTDLVAGVSTNVPFSTAIDLSNPGPNTFTTEVSFTASATIDDTEIAFINVDPNTPNAGLTASEAITDTQMELTLTIDDGGAYAATDFVEVTIGSTTVSYTATGAEDQEDAVNDLAPKLDALAGFSVTASDTTAGTITIRSATSGVAFAFSSNTDQGTVTEDVTVGAGEITVCSGTPIIFNASGGAATNGYRYLVNDTYVAAAQTSSRRSFTTLSNGDQVQVEVTDGSGCISTSRVIDIVVNLTPFDAGSPIDFSVSNAEKDNFAQEINISLTGAGDAGDADEYFVTVNGTTYTSGTGNATLNDIVDDLVADINADAATLQVSLTDNGSNFDIVSTALGTQFTVSTDSDDSDNDVIISSSVVTGQYDITYCPGENITITASGGGAGATYQFYIGGALQTNTTPNTLTFTAPGDGVIIEIVGTNTDGCSSSVYAITSLNDITDPGTIGSDETVCYNVTPPTISSTTGATFPTGASGSYKWQYSYDGTTFTDFSPIVTTLNYVFTSSINRTTYYRRAAVSDLDDNICEEYSNIVVYNVTGEEYVHVSTELEDSQEGCPNTAITDIDYYLYGGANTATVTGLPAGLSDNVIDSTPVIAIRIDGTADADDEYTVTIDGTSYGPASGGTLDAVATNLVAAIGSAAVTDAVSADDDQTIILTGVTAGTSFDVSTSAAAGANGTLLGSISIVELIPVSAAGAAGELHSVTINGRNYTYTSTTTNTPAQIVTALVSAINTAGGDADAIASAGGAASDELVLTPRVQDNFLRVSTSNDSGTNNIPTTSRPAKILRITGTPTVAVTATTRYNYTVTAGGTACTPHPTATGYIELTPNSLLTLTSAGGTDAQTLCNDTPITDIVYKVQFAGNAQVDDPTRFIDGLPTGVTAGYVATQQEEIVTVAGPMAATETMTISIDGTDVTFTAPGGGAVTADIVTAFSPGGAADLAAAVAGITVTSPGAGQISIQKNAAGVGMRVEVAETSGGTISIANEVGTGELTITGQPSVYITQDTTFTYTIRTTGNANGCTEDTATGTIEVQPSEYVHVSTELEDSQEGCPNTAITDIDYYLYGGANTATVTGLPAGLSDNVIDSTPVIAIRIDGTADADDEYTVTIDGTSYGPASGGTLDAVATNLVAAIGSAAVTDAVSADDDQTIILTGVTAGTSFDVSTSAAAGANGTLLGSISIVELIPVSAAGAAGELHSVTINGRNYTYTSTTTNTPAQIVTALVSAINTAGGDADAIASAGGAASDELVLTPRVQDNFLRVSTSNDSGTNNIPTTSRPAKILRITGTPTVAVTATTRYNYTVTAGGTACTPHPTATGYIELTPNSLLTLTSAGGTDAQTLCNDTPITDIVYKVQFAGNAQVDDPTRFIDGLPTGVTAGYVATQQEEIVTVAGPMAATETMTISIDGTDVTFTAPGGGAVTADIVTAFSPGGAADLAAAVAGITVTSPGAGQISIQKNAAGVGMRVEVAETSGGTISIANEVGTGELTITGQPSVYITQDTTFTYTIRTTGNANGCTEDTATGTIEVQPSEYVHVSTELTDTQTICESTNIDDLDYYLYGGATGATVTGMPAGLNDNVVDGVPVMSIRVGGLPELDDEFTVIIDGVPYGPVSAGTAAGVATAIIGTINSASLASDLVSANDNQTVILTGASAGTTFDVRVVVEPGANGITGGSINIVEQIVVTAPGGVGELHNVAINGRNYTYTSLAGDTAASVVTALVAVINAGAGDTDAVASVGALTDVLVLTTRNQNDFLRVSTSNDSGTNNLITTSRPAKILQIRGQPSVTISASTIYNITITTTGSGCSPETLNATFTVVPEASITLDTTGGASGQTVCNNIPGGLTDIVYNILNATNATIAAPTSLVVDGLPTGVVGAYNNSQQEDIITVTDGGGLIAGDTITITVDGTAVTFGPAAGGENTAAIVTGFLGGGSADIAAAVAGVTVTSPGAGQISIQKNVAGVPMTVSVAESSNGTITAANSVGSGQFIITGTPNVTVDATTTFNYTITTSGNPNGCGEDSITGTIIVEPAPEITRVSTLALANQTLCQPSVPITDIIYDLSGSATGATDAGLPAGVVANQTTTAKEDEITIDINAPNAPVANDTYSIAIDGGIYTHVFSAGETALQIAQSLTASITGDTNRVVNVTTAAAAGGAGIATFSVTAITPGQSHTIRTGGDRAAGISFANTTANVNRVTVNGTPAGPGTFNYTLTVAGATVCTNTDNETGTIVIATDSTAILRAGDDDSQTVCNNTNIVDIRYDIAGGATGATIDAATVLEVDGLPAGVSGAFAAGVFTITGRPVVTLNTITTYNYTIRTTGNTAGCNEAVVTGTITVEPDEEITLRSIPALTNQNVCDGTNITNIIYDLSGSAINVSDNLPVGVVQNPTRVAQIDEIEIDVTAAVTGNTYSIAVNGDIYTHTFTAGETALQVAQSLTTSITNDATAIVTVSTAAAGAPNATFQITADTPGIPFEVRRGGTNSALITLSTPTANENSITISGTPTAGAGVYNYTLTTDGATVCTSNDTENGTITISANSEINLTSAANTDSQTVCNNTAITDIEYRINNALLGAVDPPSLAVVDGLPSGVNASFVADATGGVLTISGTPNVVLAARTVFTYTINTTGNFNGCSEDTTTGTITVDPLDAGIINNSQNQFICPTDQPANLTVTGDTAVDGSIRYQWQESITGLPGSFGDIAGETGASYNFPPGTNLAGTRYYLRKIQRWNAGVLVCEIESPVHTINVNTISAGQIAMSNVICYNSDPDNIVEVESASGAGDLSYQWQMSTAGPGIGYLDIPGAINASYDPPGPLIETTYYRRVATSNFVDQLNRVTITGPTLIAENFRVTIDGVTYTGNGATPAAVVAALQPLVNGDPTVNAAINAGNPAVLDITPIVAGTTFALTVTTDSAAGTIVATDSSPVSCSVNSNVVEYTVVPEINLANTTFDRVICDGTAPGVITATGASTNPVAVGTISYQWYESTDNDTFVASAAAGNTTLALTPGVLTQNTYYYLRTTNTYDRNQIDRITVTGNSAAVAEVYEIDYDGVTYTYNKPLGSGVVSNTVIADGLETALGGAAVTIFNYGNGILDIRSNVAGAAFAITVTTAPTATVAISSIQDEEDTCTRNSDTTVIHVTPDHTITQTSGPIPPNQAICDGDPITPMNFTATGGATDLDWVGFGIPPLAFPVTVNGVTLTQNAVGDYTISGLNVTNSVNFRMTTVGTQVSEILFSGVPRIGETYFVTINGVEYDFEVTAATYANLINGLAASIQANLVPAGIGSAVPDVAARKITLTAVDDSTTFSVGLQRQGIEQETEVTIAGAAAGAGEQYTVILNGTPITYTSVGADDANTIAGALATSINGRSEVSAVAAGAVITITSSNPGISFVATGAISVGAGATIAIATTVPNTTPIGSTMYLNSISSSSCSIQNLTGNVTVTPPVTTPDYILANYNSPAEGNSRLTQQTLITDGPRVYNGSSCDTPEIASFEVCYNSGALALRPTGYEWQMTPAAAGSINFSTGVVTWDPNFTGDVTIQARALGCDGPSAWRSQVLTVYGADPISETIVISGAGVTAINDTFVVTVNGTSQTYTDFVGGNNATAIGTALTGFINTNFGVDVNATDNLDGTISVIGVPANSTFNLSITDTSATLNSLSVTVGTDSTTGPSQPTRPTPLEANQANRVVVEITPGVANYPNGLLFLLTINGRCYDYTTGGADTPQTVATALAAAVNADADRIVNAGAAGAVNANRSQFDITANYLGYSDYGTDFVVRTPSPPPGSVGTLFGPRIAPPSQLICGVEAGALPNCETTAATPNTQFFAESENYQYLVWDLPAGQINPGIGSVGTPLTNAATIQFTEQGIANWEPGFHGTFAIDVYAVGCDGTNSATQRETITILPEAVAPDAIAVAGSSTLPNCPPRAGDTTSFIIQNGVDVTWSTDNANAGTLDCVTGVMSWATGWSGTVNITATSTGCGAPSVSFPITVPPNPSVRLLSGAGTANATFCVGEEVSIAAGNAVQFTIDGGATGAVVDALVGLNGLPPGLNANFSPSQKIIEVTIQAGATAAAGENFEIFINGTRYIYTSLAAGEDEDTVAAGLINDINTALAPRVSPVTASVGATANVIRLTHDTASTFFTVVVRDDSGTINMTSDDSCTACSGIGVLTIEGTPTGPVSSVTRYSYTVRTTGTACTAGTYNAFINLNPSSGIELTSAAGTDNQTICNGEAITNVEYKVLNGATGAAIPALVNFTGLPTGVVGNFTATQQQDAITITGANAGALGEVYNLVISVNGRPPTTVDYTTLALNETADVVGAGIAARINALLGTDLTANYVAGTSSITIESDNLGVPFSVNVIDEPTLDLAVVNEVGTGIFAISGTPNVTINARSTYTYTISTSGNVFGCIETTYVGTFVVDPLETITRTNIIPAGSFPAPDNLITTNGTLNQIVCDSDPIAPIRFDLGGSAQGVSLAPLVNFTGLPNGINVNTVQTPMERRFQLAAPVIGVLPDDEITVSVNGTNYTFTVTDSDGTPGADQDVEDIIDELVNLIQNDVSSPVSAAKVGTDIIHLTADVAGQFFQVTTTINRATGTQVSIDDGGGALISVAANRYNIELDGVTTNDIVNPVGANGNLALRDALITNINTQLGATYRAFAGQVPAPPNYAVIIQRLDGAAIPAPVGIGTVIEGNAGNAVGTTPNFADVQNYQSDLAFTANPGALDVDNESYITLIGTPVKQGIKSEYYNYTIETTGTSCLPHASIQGTIMLMAAPSIELTSATLTDAQSVCEGENITPITYKVLGGATDVIEQLNGDYLELPVGVVGAYADTTQTDEITFTPTGSVAVAGETYSIQILNPTYSNTYSVSPAGGRAINDVVSDIAVQINGDINRAANAVANANVLTLTANGAGPLQGFNYNAYSTAGATFTMTATNTIGTGQFTITGAPDLSGITPAVQSNAMFNYTIATRGNQYNAGCALTAENTISGSIMVNVIESVTHNPTGDEDADGVLDNTGGVNQQVCNGGNIDPIRYDISGSADGFSITGLPPGITTRQVTQAQEAIYTIAGMANDDVFNLDIDGIRYTYTVPSAPAAVPTAAAIVNDLIIQINNDSNAEVGASVGASTDKILITASTPGDPFTHDSSMGAGSVGTIQNLLADQALEDPNINFVVIEGGPSEIVTVSKLYNFTIETTGTDCLPHATSNGSIEIMPNSSLELDVVNTDYQQVCAGELITPIKLKILGGATGARLLETIPPGPDDFTSSDPNGTPPDYRGLPSGITGNYQNENQIERISITGNAGPIGEVYSIIVDGFSVDYPTAALNETPAVLGGAIAALIDARPRVSAVADPATGEITVTADVSGPAGGFSMSIAQEPTSDLSQTSIEGTGSYIISGAADPVNSELTFTYVIETTGNPTCPTEDTFTGYLKIYPSQSITHNDRGDFDGDGTFDNTGSTAQSICRGSAIEDIRFDLSGTATGFSIPALVGTTGLPPGVNASLETRAQVDAYDITAAATENYLFEIDGIEYSYTSTATDTAEDIVDNLVLEINNATGSRASNVSVSKVGTNQIRLVADVAGTPFTVSVGRSTTPANIVQDAASVINNARFVRLSGTIQNTAQFATYTYSISTTGTYCTTATTTGTIEVLEGPSIVLQSAAATDNQTLCLSGNITDIVYRINAITPPTAGVVSPSITVSSTFGFSGLPPGINGNYVPDVSGTFGLLTISGSPDLSDPIISGITGITQFTYSVNTINSATGCSEASAQGVIRLIPDIVVDSTIIENAIVDVSCNFTNPADYDGQIGDPITNPLDSAITGGLTSVAQVDRLVLQQSALTEVNPDIGDIVSVEIDGRTYTHTVVNPLGGLTPPAQTITQIATDLADAINGDPLSNVTAQANNPGNGRISITADTPGTGFTATATITTDMVIRLTISAGANIGDNFRFTVGGTTYESGARAGGADLLQTAIAADIVADIVADVAAIVTATDNLDGTIDIRSNNPAPFTYSASTVPVAAGATLTTSDRTLTFTNQTVTNNFFSSYTFSWTKDGVALPNTTLELTGQGPGSYELTVGVNGTTLCEQIAGPFVIEMPTINVGTVSQTCGGDISVDITGTLTDSQLNGLLPIVKAELFAKDAGGTYTNLIATENFTNNTSSTFNFTAQFTGLTPGLEYRLEVTDNTCNQIQSQIIGPIVNDIAINEALITKTDQVCIGRSDGELFINNSVTGGTGQYTFEWTNLTTSQVYNSLTGDLIGIPPGRYSLTVTDAQNTSCSITTLNPVEIVSAGNTIGSTWSNLNVTSNVCPDGTEGRLEITPTGGSGSYDYKWYFQPLSLTASSSTSSSSVATVTTYEITNRSNVLVPANFFSTGASSATAVSPNYQGSSTGRYTVEIYDNASTNGCPAAIQTIDITGPTYLELGSQGVTSVDISCAGEETGSISFSIQGGTPPYFYSLVGGLPATPTSAVNTVSNLAAGTYQLVIGDSSPSTCTSNTITQSVVITEPAGGPLELSEGAITEIPCTGGQGSFEVSVSGGSSGTGSSTTYQLRVVGPGSNFVKNTSIAQGGTVTIDNLTLVGQYDVTVTDGGGCTNTIQVDIQSSAPDNLGAVALIETAVDCSSGSFNDGNEGATIRITQFDKGDGDISGYPQWEKQTEIDLDQFRINLNGNISGVNLSDIGVTIDGTSFNASSSVSATSLQDVSSNLATAINANTSYSATLNGSFIVVEGQVINGVSLTSSNTSNVNVTVSSITKVSKTSWVVVPGYTGLEVLENVPAGIYRGIVRDGSGCGGSLVQNSSQGGTTFRIDDPQALQFKDIIFDQITCNNPTSSLRFTLSNGVYDLVPDPSKFELTLNSTVLNSTVNGGVSFTTGTTTSSLSSTSTATTSTPTTSGAATVGNSYTPNLNTNKVSIDELIVGDYELVVKNLQTECVAVLNFSIEEPIGISYTGETEFTIDPCYETYQEIFFDQFLIEGGEPYSTADGEDYYFLEWTYYPEDGGPSSRINTLSNNIVFSPSAGRYELMISDRNGCEITDENDNPTPIEFIFNKTLSNISVQGAAGPNGNEFSTPVTCQGGGQDGQISIEVVSSDPNLEIPPYEIRWSRAGSRPTPNIRKLLVEGVRAGDSLEVYSIKLNENVLSYVTQEQNEPKQSVISELTQIIDSSALFNANVDTSQNPNEIIISTASGANLSLEIISTATVLRLVDTSSNIPTPIPLDGTNGTTNYTGFLNLNGLEQGTYTYSITPVNVSQCDNNQSPSAIEGTIVVEDNNILELREGPFIDSFLCNAQPGTMFLDVFAGNTGPLRFVYNGQTVSFDQVGNSQYELFIDNPVAEAQLEIYNADDCNITRSIKLGNGNPLFDFTSVNYQQQQAFVAREEITFSDNSENEYESFEFVFGDGTTSDRFVRDSPEPVTHTYGISGTYFVTLNIYNDLGCVESLTKPIVVGKGFSIQVPNVFSPNGDGVNDTFKPKFNGLGLVELAVYDYRGNLLYFESTPEDGTPVDPDNYTQPLEIIGWNGQTTIDSPYFIYSIRGVTLFDQKEVERSGTFIMLR